MIRVTPNLCEQQIRFCDEYLVSFNAYRSAITAGYSENTARKGELLHYPKIQEYLRMKMQQRSERMEITHDMLLREYAKIAFSSMANYYDYRGDIKPVSELTETEMAAISYMQTANIAEPDGYIVGAVTKIKLHNKMAALDKIAKHLGFFEAGKKSSESGAESLESLKTKPVEEVETDVNKEAEVLAVDVDGDLEVVEGGGEKRNENILTLSPLMMEDVSGKMEDVTLKNPTLSPLLGVADETAVLCG